MKVVSFPSQSVKTGGGDSFFSAKTTLQDFKEHKKSKKMCSRKEHNNFLVNHPKEMEINELSDKEFKSIV